MFHHECFVKTLEEREEAEDDPEYSWFNENYEQVYQNEWEGSEEDEMEQEQEEDEAPERPSKV